MVTFPICQFILSLKIENEKIGFTPFLVSFKGKPTKKDPMPAFNPESFSSRGEHFPEFAKNHWGKVPNFRDLGKSLMKFNSARLVAIWDREVLTTWRGNFSECKE